MERFMELFENVIITEEELYEVIDLECVNGVYYNGFSNAFEGKHMYIVLVGSDEFFFYTDKKSLD